MCNQSFKKNHAIDALWKALSIHIPSVSRRQYKNLVLFIQIKSHIMDLLLPTPAQTIDVLSALQRLISLQVRQEIRGFNLC